MSSVVRVAIQGELGSNSHLAARSLMGDAAEVVPHRTSGEVVATLLKGEAGTAVLPIENSLHGSVAEHYDLLLQAPLRIDAELELRIEHHLIAPPGVELEAVRRILSHPVALSQCRTFLAGVPGARVEPFYDTAGSVRSVMSLELRDAAGIAPRLAAELYGASVLRANVEDHPENFTRFHVLRHSDTAVPPSSVILNKMSVAFALDHRPGTLVRALAALAEVGGDLTKIESRPVAGRPWEYVFFVDLRFERGDEGAEAVLSALRAKAGGVRELGRYRAA